MSVVKFTDENLPLLTSLFIFSRCKPCISVDTLSGCGVDAFNMDSLTEDFEGY